MSLKRLGRVAVAAPVGCSGPASLRKRRAVEAAEQVVAVAAQKTHFVFAASPSTGSSKKSGHSLPPGMGTSHSFVHCFRLGEANRA